MLFHADHSLDDHYAYLGQNLLHTEDFVKLRYGYGAYLLDALLLTRIRADPKVLAVEADREIAIPLYVAMPTNETVPEVTQGPASSPVSKRGTREY